jgi:hypothetical protein
MQLAQPENGSKVTIVAGKQAPAAEVVEIMPGVSGAARFR